MSDWTHWVYVIASMSTGAPTAPVKVGLSSDPKARLQTLKTAAPFPIIGVGGFAFRSRRVAFEVEQAFHRYNSAFRTAGEWFDIDPVTAMHLLIVIIQARCEFHNVPTDHAESLLVVSGGRDRAEQTIRRLKGWNFQS